MKKGTEKQKIEEMNSIQNFYSNWRGSDTGKKQALKTWQHLFILFFNFI
jgi:hypothetical protein